MIEASLMNWNVHISDAVGLRRCVSLLTCHSTFLLETVLDCLREVTY